MKERYEQSFNPWQTLSIERPLVTKWLALRQDRVLTHTGTEITYTFLEHPGSVIVVAVTANGELLLLRQYRYTVNNWCWELPAGVVEAGDSVATARRELEEEIGGTCQEVIEMGEFYVSNGVSNEVCRVYLATGVELGENNPEESELLYVVAVAYHDALSMAHRGEINDGPSALALMLCETYLNKIQGS